MASNSSHAVPRDRAAAAAAALIPNRERDIGRSEERIRPDYINMTSSVALCPRRSRREIITRRTQIEIRRPQQSRSLEASRANFYQERRSRSDPARSSPERDIHKLMPVFVVIPTNEAPPASENVVSAPEPQHPEGANAPAASKICELFKTCMVFCLYGSVTVVFVLFILFYIIGVFHATFFYGSPGEHDVPEPAPRVGNLTSTLIMKMLPSNVADDKILNVNETLEAVDGGPY